MKGALKAEIAQPATAFFFFELVMSHLFTYRLTVPRKAVQACIYSIQAHHGRRR
jgi:hypothetical protein